MPRRTRHRPPDTLWRRNRRTKTKVPQKTQASHRHYTYLEVRKNTVGITTYKRGQEKKRQPLALSCCFTENFLNNKTLYCSMNFKCPGCKSTLFHLEDSHNGKFLIKCFKNSCGWTETVKVIPKTE